MALPLHTIPLFPLSSVVLFPGLALPLNIFEERYRALLQEVLDGPGLLGIPLLAAGHSEVGEETPPIEKLFGVGRLHDYTTHPDGTSSVLVVGVHRGRLLEELPLDGFRRGRVQLLSDAEPLDDVVESALREELIALHARALPGDLSAEDRQELADFIRNPEHPMPLVSSRLAHFLISDSNQRQQLLEIDEPEEAVRALLAHLARGLAAAQDEGGEGDAPEDLADEEGGARP